MHGLMRGRWKSVRVQRGSTGAASCRRRQIGLNCFTRHRGNSPSPYSTGENVCLPAPLPVGFLFSFPPAARVRVVGLRRVVYCAFKSTRGICIGAKTFSVALSEDIGPNATHRDAKFSRDRQLPHVCLPCGVSHGRFDFSTNSKPIC
jgi:hypothetical protein